jgi:hypothetical protein
LHLAPMRTKYVRQQSWQSSASSALESLVSNGSLDEQ